MEEKPESAEEPKSLWQKIKKPLIVVLIIIAFVLVVWLIVAITSGYLTQNWDWTGFKKGTTQITITSTSKTNYSVSVDQPYKTLWDWLQLIGILAIPAVVGFGVALYTAQQAEESDKNRQQRHKTDIKIAEENSIRGQNTALKIAEDKRHEAAYRAYLDKMSELMLDKRLAHSAPDDRIRNIARVQTLAVLLGLDAMRKGNVFKFLYESGLIGKDRHFVDLKGADLSGADLRVPDLRKVDLEEAQLQETDLGRANLSEASLKDADLNKANLSRADLSGAILIGANLSGADLYLARLNGATLNFVNLKGANLSMAFLSGANLSEADLSGAKMIVADLKGADLNKANLSEANLWEADFDNANLRGADLRGAILRKARNLSNADLSGARCNENDIPKKNDQGNAVNDEQGKPVMIKPTQWPQGFDYKSAGCQVSNT